MNPNFCRPGDPDCIPAAPSLNPATLIEREDAIIRSLASGNNACGSLIGPDGRLNLAFVRQALRPTLAVYEQEAEQLRRDNAIVRAQAESLRREVAFVEQNHPAIINQARRCLASAASRN